jgi:hypothetical protein
MSSLETAAWVLVLIVGGGLYWITTEITACRAALEEIRDDMRLAR